MRVLYVNHTAELSGSERSLLALLSGLPGDVEVLVATPRGRLWDVLVRQGVPVCEIAATAGSLRLHPLHTPRALGEMSLAALQVHRAARRHRADVVHANSIRAAIEVGLARVGPAAAIAHVRDILPPGRASTGSLRLIARTATLVLANSAYTAASVRASAPGAQVEVVHPAIDLSEFDPARIEREAARARLDAAAGGRVLLGVVAQLSPWKGQDTAIEALRLLRDGGLDGHLLLIGSAKFVARATRFDNNAYVARLREQVVAAGLEERVHWLGERDDVPELIRALDVLLLPSHEEPFGRALLEAMALEVPVVATSRGGPPELVRDGVDGCLADPGDPPAWAAAVRRILDAPDAGRGMGRAGRARVAEGFGVTSHVRRVLELYERAIAAAGRPAGRTGGAGRGA